MTSIEFRSIMIERIRAFDAWAWQDLAENPDQYPDTADFGFWNDLFNEFVESTSD